MLSLCLLQLLLHFAHHFTSVLKRLVHALQPPRFIFQKVAVTALWCQLPSCIYVHCMDHPGWPPWQTAATWQQLWTLKIQSRPLQRSIGETAWNQNMTRLQHTGDAMRCAGELTCCDAPLEPTWLQIVLVWVSNSWPNKIQNIKLMEWPLLELMEWPILKLLLDPSTWTLVQLDPLHIWRVGCWTYIHKKCCYPLWKVNFSCKLQSCRVTLATYKLKHPRILSTPPPTAHVCMCIHVLLYTCMHTYLYGHTYMHAYIHTYLYIYVWRASNWSTFRPFLSL